MPYFYFCSSTNDNLALTLNYKLNIDFRLLDRYEIAIRYSSQIELIGESFDTISEVLGLFETKISLPLYPACNLYSCLRLLSSNLSLAFH